MLGYDAPRWHAMLNDLPAALLLVAVLFDLASWAFKRESLRWAAIWTLWAGVIGGWAAVVSGTLAEEAIEHGDAIHALMERHETLGKIAMVVFTLALGWKLWRRTNLKPIEEWGIRALSVAGAVLICLVGSIGGKLVFEHAAGISNARMEAELKDRGAAARAPGDTTPAPTHQHAPGTPEHEH